MVIYYPHYYGKYWQELKSAGRCQSVVVRLICEKEDEIQNFLKDNTSSYFKTVANFNKLYKATLYYNNECAQMANEQDMRIILKYISKSIFIVNNITEKITTKSPPIPFTTDSLITEAHQRCGFTTKRTTMAAQNLYAKGFITYIRTDSPNIAPSAIKEIKKYVLTNYGLEYHREQQYESKSKSVQGAHECIRPTDINKKELNVDNHDEVALYNLIWKRTVASQMSIAKFNIKTINIDISKLENYHFIFEHEICLFDGFLKVYDKLDSNKNLTIPQKGDQLEIDETISTQEYSKPPPRYDDGSIIGKIKKLGIGRPATYNSIIQKIQDANYVCISDTNGIEKDSLILKLNNKNIVSETKKIYLGKDIKKCVPTEMGKLVNNFLIEHFPDILDYKFTSLMEDQLDDIAEGKLVLNTMLHNFYQKFKPLVENIKLDANIIKQMTNIGVHPENGYMIYTLVAKYGPMVQLMNDKKVVNKAPIKLPLTLDNITVDDAVQLFKYPINLGKYKNKTVTLCKGQYGFYLTYNSNKISIGLKLDVELDKYTLQNAIIKIEEENKKKLWYEKDKTSEYMVLEGPYGKYIVVKTNKKKSNYKIPPNINIAELTIDKVKEIMLKPKKDFIRKKIDKNNIKIKMI